MKRFYISIFLFITLCSGWNAASGQKSEDFHLQPAGIINNSIFSKVEVIDTRFDTAHIGFVQRGAFNRKAALSFAQPLKDEFTAAIAKLIERANKEDNTVIINVRDFFLSEATGSLSEYGKFIFKAGCYLKQDTVYRKMFTIDTVFMVKSGWDVSEKLLEVPNVEFGALVKRICGFDPALCDTTTSFTAWDIQHIDELEKRKIPVFQVDIPKKGLYATYKDFKNNQPSREDVLVKHKKGFSRPLVYELKENGKPGKEILHKYYYAICDGEKLYISGPYNIYPLTKRNGDYFFTGVGKDASDVASTAIASALFGIAGGLAAGNNDLAVFEYRIDPVTGKFLPVKKIKD